MNRRLQAHPTAGVLVLLLLLGLAATQCTVAPETPNPGGPPAGAFITPAPGNSGGNGGNAVVSNPGGGLPALATKPKPQDSTYQGCPPEGDGGDAALNILKNRTDSAPWYPVTIPSILALKWPSGIERKPRSNWSAADAATIARNEGTPVQIEGWLAGVKAEGPEAPNCHAVDDVDNHIWIVAAAGKDRSQSVVVEITPRMRAKHPGWALDRVRPLVDGKTKVRISGWLLLDQEHPDQVGQTRGTIWEVHPIIAIDFQRNGQWISLDTGRVSTTTSAAPPTEDPSLPPAIVDTPAPGAAPTRTPRPGAIHSGGQGTGSGVVISDIVYDGKKGSAEPDEYVEITNQGGDTVNMDGWVLHDVYGGQEFSWQGFTIQPGQQIRVYTNEVHKDSGGFSFGSKAAIWANSGDAAELLDAQGNVVATFAYGTQR